MTMAAHSFQRLMLLYRMKRRKATPILAENGEGKRMALVFALYLLLCVRVTADIRAGLADGRIQFAASVGVLMLEARIDGSVEGAKVRLNIPIRGFPEKPDGKKIRQSWPAARAVLKAADWELIALHMRAGLEDAGATAMFAGGIRAAADGLLAGLGRTGCSDIRVTADFAARGVWAAARCIVSMRVGDIMLAAAKAAGRKKRKEGLQWKSIPSRA